LKYKVHIGDHPSAGATGFGQLVNKFYDYKRPMDIAVTTWNKIARMLRKQLSLCS